MGRNCEFCGDPRPIIYCKADAACLCLPCDAKVHSANALSSRHPRTLLCEACGNRPSVARCLDHCMFICRRCDKSLHESSSQHCKQTLSIYTGCPSASNFAMLWGYDLKALPGNRSLYPLSSKTFHPILHVTKNGNNHGQSSSGTEESTLTFSDSIKNIVENKLPDCDTVLQQILELERVQLNEGDRNCSLLHDKVQREEFEGYTLKNPSDSLYQGFGIDLPKHDGSHHQLDIQHFELIFSQSRQLGSPLDSEFSSHGETFGQCKTSESSSQNWDQGMQDLGFCEDSECYGDLDMPDVDLTFCNYEEIFENDEEREELASHNFTVSSKEHDASLYKPDREHPSLIEDVEDTTSLCFSCYHDESSSRSANQAQNFT